MSARGFSSQDVLNFIVACDGGKVVEVAGLSKINEAFVACCGIAAALISCYSAFPAAVVPTAPAAK